MNAQSLLFANNSVAELEPRGFRYREDLITPAEEAALVSSLSELELKPFEFHGYLGHRRVVSFGLKYDYARRTVDPAGPVPAFLDDLLVRVSEFAGYPVDAFRQVGINEYRPGVSIGWHKDKPQFGIVAGVSLLAPAAFRLRRRIGTQWQRITHTVQPRSIYILSDEARSQWEHSIPPVDQLRYSITFRTLAEQFRAEAER